MTRNVYLILTLLSCVSVGMGLVGPDCDCDCHQLRIENNLLKHFLLPTHAPAPAPDLRASYDELNPDTTRAASPAPALWTESLIISTYTTFITSQALTEIPIWWRNRQDQTNL